MSRYPIIERIHLSRRLSFATLVLLMLGTVLAQENVDREGYFEVRSASTQSVNGVHTLDARLHMAFPNGIRGDLADLRAISAAAEGSDIVFHVAALAGNSKKAQ